MLLSAIVATAAGLLEFPGAGRRDNDFNNAGAKISGAIASAVSNKRKIPRAMSEGPRRAGAGDAVCWTVLNFSGTAGLPSSSV